jgi:hypothetical protein
VDREKLIAACGTYCGACEMYRAIHDNNDAKQQALIKAFNSRGGKFTVADLECDGCLAGGRLSPWCRECKIKDCDKRKPGETICSSECPDFPCQKLNEFTLQMPHHAEVIDNLRRLEKVGIKEHARQEEERWLCPQCRTPLAWYYKTCYKCGANRPEHLYKVPDNMFNT